jgi:hypothetical protein
LSIGQKGTCEPAIGLCSSVFDETENHKKEQKEELINSTLYMKRINRKECCVKNSNSHRVESFGRAFFFELGGLENDLLFSREGMVDARHGRQLLGRMPQLSKIPSSLLELASTEEMSSRNTGSFTSIIFPSTPKC